ncbi:conserved protein of unknown function [Ruminococcaceae bacterium BL-6]|nr:conserved protein of unknown function [Ruminococcaceae bacterium BL-6]
MKIAKNSNQSVVHKIKKEFKKNNYFCPYFIETYGKQVHCFCPDIISAPNGTYCHMKLYYKPQKEDHNN